MHRAPGRRVNRVRLLLRWVSDQFLFPLWEALFAPSDRDDPPAPDDRP